MTASWSPLAWDSEFFGIAIGTVDLDGRSPAEVLAIEQEARALGVVCLYGSLDPAAVEATVAVQALGWRFVDAAVMSSLHPKQPPLLPAPDITLRAGTVDDLPALEPLSELLAPWSRFAVDPRFGLDAARRLQAASIERAARCTTGDHDLIVAERDGSIVAFITRMVAPSRGIDAIGTADKGSGAARMLVEVSRPWAGDQPLLGGPIPARNTVAHTFVTSCGYRPTWVRYQYHRWLDEEPGGSG